MIHDEAAARERCFSCGARVPKLRGGPTHDYMLSSPGCWATFGRVLAREYEDLSYMANHRLTVDAYAVQHPGEPTPAATRSVLFHLISLCAVLERELPQREATRLIQRLADRDHEFGWLTPPGDLGDLTVLHVVGETDAAGHVAAVERWAESAWEAWASHHATIRRWVDGLT